MGRKERAGLGSPCGKAYTKAMARHRFYADLKVRGTVDADDADQARAKAQDLLARWAQAQAGSVSVERVAVLAEPTEPVAAKEGA